MKCQKCKKGFNEAGNIINYKIVCPNCKHIQKATKITPKDLIEYVEKNGKNLLKNILFEIRDILKIVLFGIIAIVLIWGVYKIIRSLPFF